MKPLQLSWLLFTAVVTAWALSTYTARTPTQPDIPPRGAKELPNVCEIGSPSCTTVDEARAAAKRVMTSESVRGPPNITTVPVKRLSYILPPVEYDHYYEGDLTIKIVDTLDELYVLCNIKTVTMLACTLPAGKSCLILMVRDEVMRRNGWTTGVILRHEIGHCNGWALDNVHVGQRPLESNTHWVPEAQRVRIPPDRLQKAAKIREGLAGPQ